jgi:hypothetical protein
MTDTHNGTISWWRGVSAAFVLTMVACAEANAPPAPAALPETARAQPDAALSRMSFIVSFRASHALGRAQSLHHAGQREEAARLADMTLRDDHALRGLCFEGFTLGGAETVLKVCAPSPWEDALVTQRRWLEQLGNTPGVAYVELNLVAEQETLPGIEAG